MFGLRNWIKRPKIRKVTNDCNPTNEGHFGPVCPLVQYEKIII